MPYNNTNSQGNDSEWLEVDNIHIFKEINYKYSVDLNPTFTDGGETLKDMIIKDLLGIC